jgi:cytochrome b pre-mRNA-processing protein 3
MPGRRLSTGGAPPQRSERMVAVLGLLGRRAETERRNRAAESLYAATVAAARLPYFYAEIGVPDTLDGRFDLLGLHAFLVIRRLNSTHDREGRALAQALFDTMFRDMDRSLREMGVGDLSVKRRISHMWNALNGRAHAYDSALGSGDATALPRALARNVWRETAPPGASERLAAIVRAQDFHLAAQDRAALLDGRVTFRAPEAAA